MLPLRHQFHKRPWGWASSRRIAADPEILTGQAFRAREATSLATHEPIDSMSFLPGWHVSCSVEIAGGMTDEA